MWIQIRAGGRGHASPDFFFIKMVQPSALWICPKYVIINLKINKFKDNFPQK